MFLIIDIVSGFVIFNVITYSLLIAELCLFWFGYQVKGLFEIYIIYQSKMLAKVRTSGFEVHKKI